MPRTVRFVRDKKWKVILGVPRPRAQSFLDGILQGFFGLASWQRKSGIIVDLKNLDSWVFLVPGYLEDYGKKFLHYKRWPGGLVNTLVVVI